MNNQITLAIVLTLVMIGASLMSSPLYAQSRFDAGDTWKGEVIDMNCYLVKGAKGPNHAPCAKSCLKSGQPMGLLTEEGILYLLGKDNEHEEVFEALKEKAGEAVRICGKLAERDGMKMLIVSKEKGGSDESNPIN